MDHDPDLPVSPGALRDLMAWALIHASSQSPPLPTPIPSSVPRFVALAAVLTAPVSLFSGLATHLDASYQADKENPPIARFSDLYHLECKCLRTMLCRLRHQASAVRCALAVLEAAPPVPTTWSVHLRDRDALQTAGAHQAIEDQHRDRDALQTVGAQLVDGRSGPPHRQQEHPSGQAGTDFLQERFGSGS